ncbi:hypothetical protein Tco_1164849 [Tanacetum coccineum]
MSAMANTTPIVATVTKPATKEKTPKDADATPRVDIQDFCKEHYEDILPVIMDKIRRNKRKEVNARLDFGERQTPGIVLIVEATLTGETLLTEIVLEAENAPAASKNHMITPAPPTGRGPNMDITFATKTAPVMRKEGGKVNPRYPAYQRATPAMEDTRSLRAAGQKKYVKDPVKINNIKQRDGETIEEFMERFKVETRLMKGAPECMRIFGFMHGANNLKLTKRLNEHVPKTMEEMMIATTAFIRGEAAAAGKKKGHASWRTQDQSKRHTSERRSNFQAGKFKPPPPMVTSVEKRSSNKFCNFHNDKGHSTDECMQLKKQIEELVRPGKLSHLIKELKQGRDQPKVGKKEVPAKDKSMAIYMIQPWHKITRQKVTQSFERVSKLHSLH